MGMPEHYKANIKFKTHLENMKSISAHSRIWDAYGQ